MTKKVVSAVQLLVVVAGTVLAADSASTYTSDGVDRLFLFAIGNAAFNAVVTYGCGRMRKWGFVPLLIALDVFKFIPLHSRMFIVVGIIGTIGGYYFGVSKPEVQSEESTSDDGDAEQVLDDKNG